MLEPHVLSMIHYLRNLNAETLSLLLFAISGLSVLVMLRAFGRVGLYVYSAVATVLGNIQVLQLAYFTSLGGDVALGTITFASIFLASDMINEHYGVRAARINVYLCLATQAITTLSMTVSLGFRGSQTALIQDAIELLFLPVPRLMFASLLAFFLGQMLEISVFHRLALLNRGRHLWLRSAVSVLLSGFVDNAAFSWLAWVALSPHPISAHELLNVYILGCYGIRVIASLLAVPVMYLSRHFIAIEET